MENICTKEGTVTSREKNSGSVGHSMDVLYSVTHIILTLQVLRLLRVAWERRLTFTIGTSVTTGATDTVVWNEIHHKTESSSNHSGHGYPDPNYLDNVLMELSLQGVEDSDTASASSSDDSL